MYRQESANGYGFYIWIHRPCIRQINVSIVAFIVAFDIVVSP